MAKDAPYIPPIVYPVCPVCGEEMHIKTTCTRSRYIDSDGTVATPVYFKCDKHLEQSVKRVMRVAFK